MHVASFKHGDEEQGLKSVWHDEPTKLLKQMQLYLRLVESSWHWPLFEQFFKQFEMSLCMFDNVFNKA